MKSFIGLEPFFKKILNCKTIQLSLQKQMIGMMGDGNLLVMFQQVFASLLNRIKSDLVSTSSHVLLPFRSRVLC